MKKPLFLFLVVIILSMLSYATYDIYSLYPYGGEIIKENVIINWSTPSGIRTETIANYIDYSNDSGTLWHQITHNYGYINNFTDGTKQPIFTYGSYSNNTKTIKIYSKTIIYNSTIDLFGSTNFAFVNSHTTTSDLGFNLKQDITGNNTNFFVSTINGYVIKLNSTKDFVSSHNLPTSDYLGLFLYNNNLWGYDSNIENITKFNSTYGINYSCKTSYIDTTNRDLISNNTHFWVVSNTKVYLFNYTCNLLKNYTINVGTNNFISTKDFKNFSISSQSSDKVFVFNNTFGLLENYSISQSNPSGIYINGNKSYFIKNTFDGTSLTIYEYEYALPDNVNIYLNNERIFNKTIQFEGLLNDILLNKTKIQTIINECSSNSCNYNLTIESNSGKINVSDLRLLYTGYVWNISSMSSLSSYRVRVTPYNITHNGTAIQSFGDFTIDNNAPSLSFYNINPNSGVIGSSFIVTINVSDLINISKVVLQISVGSLYSNQTMIKTSGNQYQYNYTTISAGVHYISFFINDTLNNLYINNSAGYFTATQIPTVISGGGSDTKRKICNITIEPNILRFEKKNIVKFDFTNNENFSISPSYVFNVKDILIRGVVTNQVLPKQMIELSLLLVNNTNVYSINETQVSVLTIKSLECKNILLPIEIIPSQKNILESGDINKIIDYIIGIMQKPVFFIGSFSVLFLYISILIFTISYVFMSLLMGENDIWTKVFVGLLVGIFFNVIIGGVIL